MSILDRLRALVSRSEEVQAAHAEDIRDPTDRPRSDQETFDEVKDDDAVAGGISPVAPTLGAGTADGLRDEFEADQEPPGDPSP
jgi:hypothetical protein